MPDLFDAFLGASQTETAPPRQPDKLPALVYGGVPIHARDEKISLTDMWRAAGSPEDRRPAAWLRSADAKRIMGYMVDIHGMGISHSDLYDTVSGGKTGGGGTWAHWHIAMAYAKYLSPKFHVWCNEVVRAHMEGSSRVVTVTGGTDEILDRLRGLETSLSNINQRTIIGSLYRHMANMRDETVEVISQRLFSGSKTLEEAIQKQVSSALEAEREHTKQHFGKARERAAWTIGVLESMQERLLPQMPNDMVSVAVVMARLNIAEDQRNLKLARSMSTAMDAWYRENEHASVTCWLSEKRSRRLFDGHYIEEWWEAEGRERYGQYATT